MAKRKHPYKAEMDEPIIVDVLEDEIEIEEVDPIEIEPEVEIEMADEPKAEEVKAESKSDREKFIETQLRIINQMNNPARQKRLAERILRK